MARRFAAVRFNLMRAIELLGDMNHADMDVTAPPSNESFFKEHEVANRLNDYLTQMIEEGAFEDCDPREPDESDDDDDGSYERGSQESEGFDYEPESSNRASKESLTGRFRRYVQRILPGRSRRHGGQDGPDAEQSGTETEPEDEEEEETDLEGVSRSSRRSGRSGRESSISGSHRSTSTRPSSVSSGSRRLDRSSRSRTRHSHDNRETSASGRRSGSGSYRERSGSEPYDPDVVYEHGHYHKHNHPGPHHHHQHSDSHTHAYHTHADNEGLQQASNEDDGGVDGISNVFRAASYEDSQDEDDLSSNPLSSRRSSRHRSGSSSRRRRSSGRSQSRGRSPSRGSR